jgi:hypothetical protein
MVGVFLVIQMADASDKRSVTPRFRPINSFFLGLETAELMVCMVFDYIVLNGRAFRATLRTGFDVNVRHFSPLSPVEIVQKIHDIRFGVNLNYVFQHWLRQNQRMGRKTVGEGSFGYAAASAGSPTPQAW